MKPRILAGLVAGSLVSWAGAAAAHPGYPGVVKEQLDLKGIYDPSGMGLGCYLCHTDPNGGSVLRPFGSKLVQSYGLSSDMVNEDDASLVNALGAMAAGADADLIADIKKGIDPNTDPGISAGALPVPEYGCAAAPANRAPQSGAALVAVAAAVLGLRRRRQKRMP